MITANDHNFDKILSESKNLVLIYIWATFCGPCKLFSPVIEEISGIYKDKLDVIKINAEESQSIVNRYSIISVPTIILTDKQSIIARKNGAVPKKNVVDFIDKFISKGE